MLINLMILMTNNLHKNKHKTTIQPIRRSQRNNNLVYYHDAKLPTNDKEIFDVLDI